MCVARSAASGDHVEKLHSSTLQQRNDPFEDDRLNVFARAIVRRRPLERRKRPRRRRNRPRPRGPRQAFVQISSRQTSSNIDSASATTGPVVHYGRCRRSFLADVLPSALVRSRSGGRFSSRVGDPQLQVIPQDDPRESCHRLLTGCSVRQSSGGPPARSR